MVELVFGIIEDRKFKSGCAGLVPGKQGRPDHFPEPSFDPAIVDLPGLTLLGDRQHTFLDNWTADWRGQDMKVSCIPNSLCKHGNAPWGQFAAPSMAIWIQMGGQ